MLVKQDEGRGGLANAHQLVCPLEDILWLRMGWRRHGERGGAARVDLDGIVMSTMRMRMRLPMEFYLVCGHKCDILKWGYSLSLGSKEILGDQSVIYYEQFSDWIVSGA